MMMRVRKNTALHSWLRRESLPGVRVSPLRNGDHGSSISPPIIHQMPKSSAPRERRLADVAQVEADRLQTSGERYGERDDDGAAQLPKKQEQMIATRIIPSQVVLQVSTCTSPGLSVQNGRTFHTCAECHGSACLPRGCFQNRSECRFAAARCLDGVRIVDDHPRRWSPAICPADLAPFVTVAISLTVTGVPFCVFTTVSSMSAHWCRDPGMHVDLLRALSDKAAPTCVVAAICCSLAMLSVATASPGQLDLYSLVGPRSSIVHHSG